MVQSRDVLGWTNEQQHTLISFNSHPTYRVHFYRLLSGRRPAVNETVEVEDIDYPAVFSVAVEIVQR